MEEHPVQMDLKEYVIQVVEIAAPKIVADTVKATMDEHLRNCPREIVFAELEKLELRVNRIELRFATLIGLMIGSGVFGGAVSGTLIHFMGG